MGEEVHTGRESLTFERNVKYDLSRILGLTTFSLLVVCAIAWGGDFTLFVNIPSIIICLGGTITLSVIAYGFADLKSACTLLRYILTPTPILPERIRSHDVKVLRGMIVHLYAVGVVGFAIGMIQLFHYVDDMARFLPALAVALLCPFYSLLGAEVLLRPMAQRLEHSLKAHREN